DGSEPGSASKDRGREPMVRAESASRDKGARTTLERVADHKLELARLVPAVRWTRALIALHVQPGPWKPPLIELQRAHRGGRRHEWGPGKLLLRGGIRPKQREIRIGHAPLSHDPGRGRNARNQALTPPAGLSYPRPHSPQHRRPIHGRGRARRDRSERVGCPATPAPPESRDPRSDR